LPYTLACTVKPRPRTTSILTTKRGKGKKKKLVLARAGLSSYLCRPCAICQSVQARGGIHLTTLKSSKRRRRVGSKSLSMSTKTMVSGRVGMS
jgi:hypothetical protein